MKTVKGTKNKTIALGNEGVGKTSMYTTYITNSFPKQCSPTKTKKKYTAQAFFKGDSIILDFWDLPCQHEDEENRSTSYSETSVKFIE